jgi:hypothetical protein
MPSGSKFLRVISDRISHVFASKSLRMVNKAAPAAAWLAPATCDEGLWGDVGYSTLAVQGRVRGNGSSLGRAPHGGTA